MLNIFNQIGLLATDDVRTITDMAEGKINYAEIGNCFLYWYHNEELLIINRDEKVVYSWWAPSRNHLKNALARVLENCPCAFNMRTIKFFSKEMIDKILIDPMAEGCA